MGKRGVGSGNGYHPKVKKIRCVCMQCGRYFKVYPSRYKQAKGRVSYCSIRCMGLHRVGKNHPRWNPVKSLEESIRQSSEYREWRLSVFHRDSFTCLKCSQRGGELNAHHIYPFKTYKELRMVLSNGVTLCKRCHVEFHHDYGKWKYNPEDFSKFLLKEKD